MRSGDVSASFTSASSRVSLSSRRAERGPRMPQAAEAEATGSTAGHGESSIAGVGESSEPLANPVPTPRRAVLGAVAASIAGMGMGTWSPLVVFAAAEDAAAEAEVAASTSSYLAAAAVRREGAVLITGANSGVGFSAAKLIAAQGKRVVLACRTEAKGIAAAAAIREKVPGARLDVLPGVGLEMTDLRATGDYVRAFQDSGIPLDVLVLNAGIMAVPLGRTEQDHELHFGVNHLAHFLVQDGLMPQLRMREKDTGERGRLVSCSSIANTLPNALDVTDLDWRRRGYNEWTAYCASKAANVLMTDEVARRELTVASNSFHPGIVTTNLVRYILPDLTAENRDPTAEKKTSNGKLLAKLGIRGADEGAKSHVWLSTATEAGDVSGRFFIDPGVEYPGATRAQLVAGGDWFLLTGKEPLAAQLRLPESLFDWRTQANAAALWERSVEMIQPFRV